jgi:hypothetical protein
MTQPFVIPEKPNDKETEDMVLEMANDPKLARILTLDDWILVDQIRLERGQFRNTSIMAAQEEADRLRERQS